MAHSSSSASSAFAPWSIPREHDLFGAQTTRLPSLFDRGAPWNGAPSCLTSDNRSTSSNLPSPPFTAALRPIVVEKEKIDQPFQLPSIHDIFPPSFNNEPSSSPPLTKSSLSSPDRSGSWSPRSFGNSNNNYSSRKGSIASLLNSDSESSSSRNGIPALCNEQEHDDSKKNSDAPSLPPRRSAMLKRGRPRQYAPTTIKKKKQKCGSKEDDSGSNSRATKGLRHFSKLVSDKVAERGVTTYNEVADELATEIRASNKGKDGCYYDQKNIRRRVYDALNVLMAMDIIAKNKKEIRWLGMPPSLVQPKQQPSSSRVQELELQIQQEEQRQAQLTASLQQMENAVRDKLERYLQIRNLIWKNEQDHHDNHQEKLFLPLHAIACDASPHHQVNLSADGRQAEIITCASSSTSESSIAVYDDTAVLRALGYSQMSSNQKLAWLPDPKWRQFIQCHDLSSSQADRPIDPVAAA